MPELVNTLHKTLHHADEVFEQARYVVARTAFEHLLQLAQERADRPTEVTARSMLARCLLQLNDLGDARYQLQEAALRLDPGHSDSHGRYRAALARLASEEGPKETAARELIEYLRWAEKADADACVIDACMLIANASEFEERVEWLHRAIERATQSQHSTVLGSAFTDLAAALDLLERPEEAVEAYQQALSWHRIHGSARQVIGSCWAVGAAAGRIEDWPLARTHLEEAIEQATTRVDCEDLLGFALAELARGHEAAGDVIEARRLVIRAVRIAREQQLSELWPERWSALEAYARQLEVL